MPLNKNRSAAEKNRTDRSTCCAVLFRIVVSVLAFLLCTPAHAAPLMAGVAKVDITNAEAGPVNDPLYAKALVLNNDTTTLVVVTVDAVAVAEIGPIGNDFLPMVRTRLEKEVGVAPKNVLVNASHCHGVVCADVADRTVEAVTEAWKNRVEVRIGAGVGHEDRIQENRRFRLKDGRQADSRRAYALPPDETIAEVGPIDPEIGVLRLDKRNGDTLAVVYNFACHPIQGVPGGGNTADMIGFASKIIEENLASGTIALFLQGCAGDINPAHYKDVHHPHDAEPLGNLLGLSTLRAVRNIQTRDDDRLRVVSETIELPRADTAERIVGLEAERLRLVESLRGTNINLKTFVPLAIRYGLSPGFPSDYAHRYLHEAMLGREALKTLDAENRANFEQYVQNIYTMEELTRIQTNLQLLRKHQAANAAAGSSVIDAEVIGARIGDFVLVTFPGEPTVRVGLNIKERSPHALTFIAGYTNGYLYYAPTAEQLRNTGAAQEDSDCLLAPEWQERYERQVLQMLRQL